MPQQERDGLEQYPFSVLERLKALIHDDNVTQSQVATLLEIPEEEITQRLLGGPAEATPEEIMEFEELPW